MLIAALVATDAHWGILQSVAWTTMLVNHLHTGSLRQAVSATFDGKHPCCLCKAVAAAKKSEQKKPVVVSLKQLEFVSPGVSFVFQAPLSFRFTPLLRVTWKSVPQTPLLPPPRFS